MYVAELLDICADPGTLKMFKFLGHLLNVAFIVIPILLIVMGTIDFVKAVMASKDDEIKKAQIIFVKRAIAAVIVFFIPLIVNLTMGVVLNQQKSKCITCILNPNSCKINN